MSKCCHTKFIISLWCRWGWLWGELAVGNEKRAKQIRISISYHLPYTQIYIYLLFYEAPCTLEPLASILHMIRVDKYGVVLLRTTDLKDLQNRNCNCLRSQVVELWNPLLNLQSPHFPPAAPRLHQSKQGH